MAIVSEDLVAFVGASQSDAAYAGTCVAVAEALVAQYVGDAEIPEAILDRAVLEAGSKLFHRRQEPNGSAQFATPEGAAPIRGPLDPMVVVRPLLAPYLPLGFSS